MVFALTHPGGLQRFVHEERSGACTNVSRVMALEHEPVDPRL